MILIFGSLHTSTKKFVFNEIEMTVQLPTQEAGAQTHHLEYDVPNANKLQFTLAIKLV